MRIVLEVATITRIKPVVGNSNGKASCSIGSSQVEFLGIIPFRKAYTTLPQPVNEKPL